MSEQVERARVTQIARSFLGKPYQHAGDGISGVDCATLLAFVYGRARIIPMPRRPLMRYSPQWHMHRRDEKLSRVVASVAREVDYWPPRPGDIVLWRFYHLFCHGSIAMRWPNIIHAHLQAGQVTEENVDRAGWLDIYGEPGELNGRPRPRKVFTFWPQDQRIPYNEMPDQW